MFSAITIINTKYRINKPNVHFIQILLRKAYIFFLGKGIVTGMTQWLTKESMWVSPGSCSKRNQLWQGSIIIQMVSEVSKWQKRKLQQGFLRCQYGAIQKIAYILKQIYVYRIQVDFITCVKAFALYNDNNHYKY